MPLVLASRAKMTPGCWDFFRSVFAPLLHDLFSCSLDGKGKGGVYPQALVIDEVGYFLFIHAGEALL